MLTYSQYHAPGIWIDKSSKIVTGGTSQTALASNGNRRRLLIQNPATTGSQGIGATENLYINFTVGSSSTTGSSIELLPGGSYDSDSGPCTTEAITVVAATTGHQYLIKEMS